MPDAEFHVDDAFGAPPEGRVRYVNDFRRQDLSLYVKGEGASYISDYLHRSAFHTATPIPKRVAQMILDDLGITRFDNKEFVRINSNDELEGMRDEPMFTFLYFHDHTYWLYNLR
jgi:hypothetical protein